MGCAASEARDRRPRPRPGSSPLSPPNPGQRRASPGHSAGVSTEAEPVPSPHHLGARPRGRGTGTSGTRSFWGTLGTPVPGVYRTRPKHERRPPQHVRGQWAFTRSTCARENTHTSRSSDPGRSGRKTPHPHTGSVRLCPTPPGAPAPAGGVRPLAHSLRPQHRGGSPARARPGCTARVQHGAGTEQALSERWLREEAAVEALEGSVDTVRAPPPGPLWGQRVPRPGGSWREEGVWPQSSNTDELGTQDEPLGFLRLSRLTDRPLGR